MKKWVKVIIIVLLGLFTSGCKSEILNEQSRKVKPDEAKISDSSQTEKTNTDLPTNMVALYQKIGGPKRPLANLKLEPLEKGGLFCGNTSELEYFEYESSDYQVNFYEETNENNYGLLNLNKEKELIAFHYETSSFDELKDILVLLDFPLPKELAEPLTEEQEGIQRSYENQNNYLTISVYLEEDQPENESDLVTYSISYYHQYKVQPGMGQLVGEKVEDSQRL